MINREVLLLLLLPLVCLSAPSFDKATLDELDDIIHGRSYDARLRPGGDGPVTVSLSGYILHLDHVDLDNNEITLTMYFRQFWTDERLKISKRVVLNDISGIWHPDTFIVHEKRMPTVEEEEFVRIDPSGEVLYSKKITKKLSCVPDEDSTCQLDFESYGFTSADIDYQINEGEGQSFQFAPDRVQQGYKITGLNPKVITATLSSGTYSRLLVEINIEKSV